MAKFSVLIVDDEKNIRHTLRVCLETMETTVVEAGSAQAALDAMARAAFDLVFLDLRLGQESGLDLIPRLLGENPNVVIVVVTAYATIETAVEAIRRGAWDYLPKPFTPAQIGHVVEKAKAHRAASARLVDLEDRLQSEAPEIDLESRAPAMRAVLEIVNRAAQADVSVLFRGPSGTGKGVLARAMHLESKRRDRPFVTINCPTLTEELLASELFGHTKGAFTGAVRDQPGRVEAAEGGTLFLDEIGDISPLLQANLLRFVEAKEFERLGENQTRRADVRTIAATNRDIEDHVRRGLFREDLLYRLNVITLQLPPLRERPEDILRLARRFLIFFARSARRRPQELSKAAEEALLAYTWPGNIRELRNTIERAAILWPAQLIEPEAFPAHIAASTSSKSAAAQLGGDFTLDVIEREHIMRIVSRTPTLEDAAAILGIDASTLWRKRKKYES